MENSKIFQLLFPFAARQKKINFLILIFLISIVSSNAQVNYDWYPVHPNIQYNYKVDTSALPLSVVIKIDSITLNSPLYHLNKIVTACDTCQNNLLLNDLFDSTYVLAHQPQFLSHRFFKKPDNSFCFKGNRDFVIRPFQAIGNLWVCDSVQNISAKILLRTAQPVLGVMDSVCIILLSTNDTIVLSKNSGIVRFPFKTTLPHYYQLVGYEGAISLGVKLKRFHDFFDFAAGDVLQYQFEEDDYNLFPPSFDRGYERWDFLSVSVFSDSLLCRIRKTRQDTVQFGASDPMGTSDTQTLNVVFKDSANHVANLYPLQEVLVNPYFIFNNGIRAIHKITVGQNNQRAVKGFGENCPSVFLSGGMTGAASQTPFSDVFLNQNSRRIVGRELTEGLGFTSELFNNYDRISQRCLIGFIKGNDTSGTILNNLVLSVQTNNKAVVHWSIYPSPAKDFFSIKGTLDAGTRIQLINPVGEIVFNTLLDHLNFSYEVPASTVDNGLYFVVISNSYLTEVKKLIIQH